METQEMVAFQEQMSKFRKEYRKRAKVEFNDSTMDHSSNIKGKRNCRRCYGRGYQEMLTYDGTSLYRLNCACAKITKK